MYEQVLEKRNESVPVMHQLFLHNLSHSLINVSQIADSF